MIPQCPLNRFSPRRSARLNACSQNLKFRGEPTSLFIKPRKTTVLQRFFFVKTSFAVYCTRWRTIAWLGTDGGNWMISASGTTPAVGHPLNRWRLKRQKQDRRHSSDYSVRPLAFRLSRVSMIFQAVRQAVDSLKNLKMHTPSFRGTCHPLQNARLKG